MIYRFRDISFQISKNLPCSKHKNFKFHILCILKFPTYLICNADLYPKPELWAAQVIKVAPQAHAQLL